MLDSAGFSAAHRVDETGSTNADLLNLPMTERPRGPVLRWANHQTAGRGRRGTAWIDDPGHSLTFSVALEYNCTAPLPSPLPGYTLVAGLSIRSAILADPLPVRGQIRLKWPNDLVLDDAKLCGILVEARQQGKTGRLVVGCGLNLRPPAALNRQAGALPATGLLANGQPWRDAASEQLVASIAIQLAQDFAQFARDGFASFRQAWESANYFGDKSVELRHDGQELITGCCRGVDDSGALLIESAGIIKGYSIGVVSARVGTGAV